MIMITSIARHIVPVRVRVVARTAHAQVRRALLTGGRGRHGRQYGAGAGPGGERGREHINGGRRVGPRRRLPRVGRLLGEPDPREAKVGELDVPRAVDEDVVRFDIPVAHTQFVVEVPERFK